MPKQIELIIITGQTASGKNAVGRQLAKFIEGKLISCDSMKVYKGMDILCAKPEKKDEFHMIDVIEPSESFCVKAYIDMVSDLIKKIHLRKKLPILVGGTILYIKALSEGLFEGPGSNWNLRETLIKEAQKFGSQGLYNKLKSFDPEGAKKIHQNDLRRIIRAIEVYEETGIPFSCHHMQFGRVKNIYKRRLFGLRRKKEDLFSRIDKRVNKMFKDGVIEEVICLIKKYSVLSREASQVLGYKEILDLINGKISKQKAKDLIKTHTKQFAKRQMTWLKRFKDLVWINTTPDEMPKDSAKRILSALMDR